MTLNTQKPVLVTGLTGFVGSALALTLLKKGYKVRAAVRTRDRAEPFKTHPLWSKYIDGQLEIVAVGSLAAPGAFDKAIEGVEYVHHVAAPLPSVIKDPVKDMLDPAVKGSLNMLRAASQPESIVKRITFTSSFGACEDYGQPWKPSYTYNEDSWCPIERSRAEAFENNDQALVYCCAKKEAEQAVWKWVKDNKPKFDVNVVVPVFIIGPTVLPVKGVSSLPASLASIGKYFHSNSLPSEPVAPPMVALADVVSAHIACQEIPKAGGQRFLIGGYGHTPGLVASWLRKGIPEAVDRIPEGDETPVGSDFKWVASKAERELGLTYTPLNVAVVAAGKQYLELEKAS